ncbi:MAG TPA: M48 family metallopeptidase [Bryobacteraceae bacterium]|nr:M48 family metallopeptidase [Bryobacteraceae bacterium]
MPVANAQYTLPPDQLALAIRYSHALYWLHFLGAFLAIAVLIAILATGLAGKLRDWAERVSRRRLIQTALFVPALLLVNDVLNLPIGITAQTVEVKFNQSIESWPAWLWDWAKAELITAVVATVLATILYVIIRRSPRRWWLYFWLAGLPLLAGAMVVEPYLIEPLFYKFEPLAVKHPALVQDMEKLVARAGLEIPPERMFEMQASDKVNSLNAYVSGFGASKRIVVWDTTIAKLTRPEILSVFGHELGHYVLGHIRDGMIAGALFTLLLLYAGFHAIHGMLRRWGTGWGVREAGDLASAPALLLLFTIFSFLSEPIVNGYSRRQEHQADMYGIEILHDMVPDDRAVTIHGFQVMGEISLDEPDPNPFIVFWAFTHPTTSDRIRFTATYDPWSHGTARYVK